MLTPEDHIAQAERNLVFYRSLMSNTESPREWAATILFYIVVHYGRALVVKRTGKSVQSHIAFQGAFNKLKPPQQVYEAYRTLEDESRYARYDCIKFDDQRVKSLEQTVFADFSLWVRRELTF